MVDTTKATNQATNAPAPTRIGRDGKEKDAVLRVRGLKKYFPIQSGLIIQRSVGAVKGRLERGRVLLRGRLMRRGVTLSAALLATLINESVSASVPFDHRPTGDG